MVSTTAGGVSGRSRGRVTEAPAVARTTATSRRRRRPARPPMSNGLYNFVVFASVLLFMILAAGVGMLALESALR